MVNLPPLVIAGGGLAGSLAALCLSRLRPDLPLLLLEGGDCFGGNHTWSFFDGDVPAGAADLIDSLSPVRWPRHEVRFPGREREFDVAYSAIAAPALDRLVRERLPEGAWRLETQIARIEPDKVVLQSGEQIDAGGVIDARGPAGEMPGLDLRWQKFVGIEFEASAHDPGLATVMDARVPQMDGYRFVYVLPLARDRVLIEDTYYSDERALDVPAVAQRVRDLGRQRGLSGAEVRQEVGVLPILLGGDPDLFWPREDPIPRLGLRGGFFHATTGYSLGLALQTALGLAEYKGPFDSASLAQWSRERFVQHWRDMRFFRLLNRMLFDAAAPDERYKVFEHFYRLPSDLIGRFYAGTPTLADRLRILSGRPPVPVGRAIRALIGR